MTRAQEALGAFVLVVLAIALTASPTWAAGTLTVEIQGKGAVTDDADPPKIDCFTDGGPGLPGTPDCTQAYEDERFCFEGPRGVEECSTVIPRVSLTAAEFDSTGYAFDRWTGCDESDDAGCHVTMDGDKTVVARFRDVSAPRIPGLSPAAGAAVRGEVPLTATASDNDRVARVEFRLGGALAGVDTAPPYAVAYDTATVPDGTAVLQIRAFDPSGLSGSRSHSITIDNTAPTVGVDGPGTRDTFGPGSAQTWALDAGDATSGVASVACSVTPAGDAPAFGACTGGTASHTVSGLAGGEYVLAVRVRDGAGNERVEGRSFSIDATPPRTRIVSGPPDGSAAPERTVTFGLSSSESGSGFRCRMYPSGLTGPPYEACSGGDAHTAAGLAPGTYVFEAFAIDAAGNVDTSAERRSFTVEPPAGDDAGPPPPAPPAPVPPAPAPLAPPAPITPSGDAAKFPAKLQVLRAGVEDGRLDVLAKITKRATGKVDVRFVAAGKTERFDAEIDEETGFIRIDRELDRDQARKGTGIIEIEYAGNDRVRPDEVRLRAASGKARLKREKAAIENGRLIVEGTISDRARGVVRIRMGYVDAAGELQFLKLRADIEDGEWKLDEQLPPAAAAKGGQLSIQFTGYLERRIRGEQDAKQVLP